MNDIPTDHARLPRNLIAIGTIADSNPASWTVRLDLDGRRTGWPRMPTEIGRNFKRWRPPRLGSQVVIACPSGDHGQCRHHRPPVHRRPEAAGHQFGKPAPLLAHYVRVEPKPKYDRRSGNPKMLSA